jgi:AraC family transcriptional activator of tynA and feaB
MPAGQVAALHSTEALPPARQYDRWRETVSDTHLGWELPRRREGAFLGRIAHQALGPVDLLQCVCEPCGGRRGRAELSRAGAAYYGLLYLLRGSERLTQAGHEVELRPGYFTLWDSTRPMGFAMPGGLAKITLLVPQPLLDAVLPGARDLTGLPIDGRQGRGALFATHLRALARESREGGDCPAPVLRATFELLAAALEPAQAEEASAYHLALRARIRGFILENLADPGLEPERIAESIGISARQLYRVFGEGGMTVERWIWQQRLLRCRRDLLLRPGDPISQIAFRWGFSDAAHFSRSFRARFGLPPRQFRRQALGRGEPEPPLVP